MKILFVAGRPGAATGSSTYRECVLERVLPSVDGAIYRGPEDLEHQWDWIHVLDGKLIPPELMNGERNNLIVDVHDHYWVSPPSFPAPDQLLRRIIQKKRKKHYLPVLRRAARVFVHSEAVRAAIDHDDVHNVGLGVKLPDSAHFDRENKTRILLAGRDLFRKGVIPLIGAIREVRKEIPGIELVIAGKEYPHSLYFTRLISLGLPVHFAGQCSHDRMEELYGAARCVVLPSWIEAFGLVLIEGMARGVPVIAADAGGMPEAVSHQKTGQLFPPGDVRALAGAIRTIWKESSRVRGWAEAARRDVERRFSDESMALRILKAYQSERQRD